MLSSLSTQFNGINKNIISSIASTWTQLSSQAVMIAQPLTNSTYTTTTATSYGTCSITYSSASIASFYRKGSNKTFLSNGGSILFGFPSGLSNLNKGYTISFWVYFTSTANDYTLMLMPGPNAYRWGASVQTTSSINGGKLTPQTQLTSGSTAFTSVYENVKYSANTWYNYCISYDNITGQLSLYKNGNLESQSIEYSGISNSPYYGNFGYYNISQIFYVDAVYLFNRVLVQSEINLLYANS